MALSGFGLEFEWLTDLHLPVTGNQNCFISMFCWRAKGCCGLGLGHNLQGLGLATLQVALTTESTLLIFQAISELQLACRSFALRAQLHIDKVFYFGG